MALMRFLKYLLLLPLFFLVPFWAWIFVPLFTWLPWWGFLGLCYLFAGLGVDEYQAHETKIAVAQAALHQVERSRVDLNDFDPTLHVGAGREVTLRVQRLEWSQPQILKGEKLLRYAIVPFGGQDGGSVELVAIDTSADGYDLARVVDANGDALGEVVLSGQLNPATPWLTRSDIRRALINRGYEVAEEFWLVAPYLEGRDTWWRKEVKSSWFWVSLQFSLAMVFGIAGLVKLRRWLARLQT